MSTDLEQLLRRTLQHRAAEVSSGPGWEPPLRNRRPKWIAAIAAAAAVAAVAVAAVLIPSWHHNGAPPANSTTPAPSPSPSSSPSPSPTHTPAPVVPAACRTALPHAWQQAFAGGQLDLGGIAATPLSVAPDGAIVIARDGGLTPGSPRDVLLLRPGHAAQSVYEVPDPDHFVVRDAELSGHWLIVALERDDRPGPGTVPGNSPVPNVDRLIALDLTTPRQHVIRTIPTNPSGAFIDQDIVLDGRVYWDERTNFTSDQGVIKSYGVQSGDVRTEYSGKMDEYPIFSAAGVGGTNGVYVRAALPQPVADGLDPRYPFLVATDGTAYAWQVGTHEIGWWAPGRPAPTYLRVRDELSVSYPGQIVVSGHFVVTLNRTLIDMRNGAEASIAGGNVPTGKFFEPAVAAGNGILAAVNNVGTGHFVNGYWEDPQARVLRIATAHLPDLHC
jgi:hypothetical protein